MFALGLSLLLFLFWWALGHAVLALLHTRRNLVQNLLLAPVVGASTNLLPVFWLSRVGFPVKNIAVGVGAVLILFIAAVIWWLRPLIPLRLCGFFSVVLLLSFFLAGRPMLEFGFAWVSYGNSDMANYVLGAHRFLEHGYFDLPDIATFVQNQEPSLKYWFWAPLGIRAGSELTLAWVVGMTGLNGHQVFMPVILALHLVLISSISAFVCSSTRFRLEAGLTALLVGLSALSTFGVLLQLTAQVFGLSLLSGMAAVLMRTFRNWPPKLLLRHSVLAAILISASLVVYPEILPFLLLSLAAYWMIQRSRRQIPVPVSTYVATTVLSFLCLNTYLASALDFLRIQAGVPQVSGDIGVSLFPYFLIPSGIADFWGFSAIPGRLTEPWLSIAIVLGAGLLTMAIAGTVWQARKAEPVAVVTMVMLPAVFYLFFLRSDFVLFKMAMFIQPFLCGTLVVAWLQWTRAIFKETRRTRSRNSLILAVLPLLCLGVLGVNSQVSYVEQSRGFGFTEVRGASVLRITEEMNKIVDQVRSPVIVLDTSSDVIAKLFSLYTKNKALSTPAKNYYPTPSREYYLNAIAGNLATLRQEDLLFWTKSAGDALRRYGLRLLDESKRGWLDARFDLKNQAGPNIYNEFQIAVRGTPPGIEAKDVTVVATASTGSVVNRRSHLFSDSEPKTSFYAQPWNEMRNHLMFIHSEKGQQYFLADRRRVALFPTEADVFYPGSTMSGAGRHILFQAINPSEGARMVLDLTATLKGDGSNDLPPAVVIGNERYPFPLTGRGSARVVSPPLAPQIVAGRPFLAIDMGTDGTTFSDERTGLMKLYGGDVPRDYRHLVAFVRAISLLEAGEYERMQTPSKLAVFPADLAQPHLEYSGLYEDGWISEDAFLRLNQPTDAATLAIRGMVPLIRDSSFRTEFRLSVDGHELVKRELRPGDFEIRAELPAKVGRRDVRLSFSKFQRLTAPDNRPAAALLRFVGFETRTKGQSAVQDELRDAGRATNR